MNDMMINVLLCWAVVAGIMLLLWYQQLRSENAGVVDVAWAYLTGVSAAILVLSVPGGLAERKLLLAIMALLWGLRLGTFLFRRVIGKPEDSRYRYLRGYLHERYGKRASLILLLFFQLQASWVVLFCIPYMAAAASTARLGLFDLVGVLVWLIAMAGETIADAQLSRFKANPDNQGKVCRIGLWRLSRHPNYFFEWLTWWAFVFIGIGSSWWWLTLAGVAIMYVFITRLTGIPHTEQQLVRSRGDAYRRYQQSTSRFFPWPAKPMPGSGG